MAKTKVKEFNSISRVIDKRVEVWEFLKNSKDTNVNKDVVKSVLKELKYLQGVSIELK